MEQLQTSIIDEMEQYRPIPYATSWQRFANFLIDWVVYYLVYMFIVFVLAILTEILQTDMVSTLVSEEPIDRLLATLFATFVMFCVYLLTEGLSRGRTLGKLITGTRAVREDNSEITWKDALKRSLARIIPFEPFSAFSGSGMWHDRLAKTMVVNTR